MTEKVRLLSQLRVGESGKVEIGSIAILLPESDKTELAPEESQFWVDGDAPLAEERSTLSNRLATVHRRSSGFDIDVPSFEDRWVLSIKSRVGDDRNWLPAHRLRFLAP